MPRPLLPNLNTAVFPDVHISSVGPCYAVDFFFTRPNLQFARPPGANFGPDSIVLSSHDGVDDSTQLHVGDRLVCIQDVAHFPAGFFVDRHTIEQLSRALRKLTPPIRLHFEPCPPHSELLARRGPARLRFRAGYSYGLSDITSQDVVVTKGAMLFYEQFRPQDYDQIASEPTQKQLDAAGIWIGIIDLGFHSKSYLIDNRMLVWHNETDGYQKFSIINSRGHRIYLFTRKSPMLDDALWTFMLGCHLVRHTEVPDLMPRMRAILRDRTSEVVKAIRKGAATSRFIGEQPTLHQTVNFNCQASNQHVTGQASTQHVTGQASPHPDPTQRESNPTQPNTPSDRRRSARFRLTPYIFKLIFQFAGYNRGYTFLGTVKYVNPAKFETSQLPTRYSIVFKMCRPQLIPDVVFHPTICARVETNLIKQTDTAVLVRKPRTRRTPKRKRS